MFNRTNALILLVAIVGALGGFLAGGLLRPLPSPHADPHALKIGDTVAAIHRPDMEGKAHAFEEWRGKLVLVNFWASWCGPCRDEMPLLDKTQQRLAGKGLQIIGVASDDRASTERFLKRVPVHYPILIDDPETESQDLAALLGNDRSVLPYTVLLGRDGRILARRAGQFDDATLDAWLSPHL